MGAASDSRSLRTRALVSPLSAHPLAGHQIVLEGWVSGGQSSHYQTASLLRFCPCVPAMELKLRDLHKASAIYYSAVCVGVWS